MIDILNLLSLLFKLIWAVVSFPFSLVLNVVGFLIYSTWAIVSFPVNLVWNIGHILIGTAMSVILFFTNPFGVSSSQYAVEPSSTLSVSVPLSQVDSSSIANYQMTDAVSDAPEQSAFTDFVSGTCKKLRAQGLSNFRRGDVNYTAKRDRDGDGIACESR